MHTLEPVAPIATTVALSRHALNAAAVSDAQIRVLLVEDDPAATALIQQALDGPSGSRYRLEWVTRLADAITCLRRDNADVILLDLTLPDCQGIDAFDRVFAAAPNVPILILSGANDETNVRLAVQRGAHDYLARPHIDSHWLPRALRYVIERQKTGAVLRAAEEALFEEKERAQVTLNSIGDAVLATDVAGNVTYLNRAAERMTGWSHDEALGRPLAEVFRIVDSATRKTAENPALRAIMEHRTVGLAADCVLVRRDGSELAVEDSSAPIRSRDGRVAGAVLVFRDVSEARAMAQKMAHLAQHDFLTGLPNRVLLTERLSQSIGLARRHGKQVALLYLDLDNFKTINDSLGHAIGDQLLQSVAERLTACVRTTDTVCRQGGDEFVILLAEIEQPQDAANVAEKILAALAVPRHLGSHEIHVTPSIGISVYPDDGNSADAVMKNADTAMYHAKASGRDNYQFFRADMNTRAGRRLVV